MTARTYATRTLYGNPRITRFTPSRIAGPASRVVRSLTSADITPRQRTTFPSGVTASITSVPSSQRTVRDSTSSGVPYHHQGSHRRAHPGGQ